MNLRVFKKDIEYFIGEFIEDCDLFVLLNPQQDSEEINSLKQRAAHPEGPKKAYYNGLIKEMFEKLDELSVSGRTKIIQGSRVVALDFFVRRRQTDSQEDERENGAGRPKCRSTGVRERRLSGKSAPEGPFPAQRLGAQVGQRLHEERGAEETASGRAWKAVEQSWAGGSNIFLPAALKAQVIGREGNPSRPMTCNMEKHDFYSHWAYKVMSSSMVVTSASV